MSKDTYSRSGADGDSVIRFYNGAAILVTGATGFVGKALVEKLLRSCPGIETIFLLIRPKKGMGPKERLKELLDNIVFDRVRDTGALNKVVAVAGDVMDSGLGLSDADKARLCATVNIVFHSAATVKFNEKLQDAVRLNTMGTQSVIELCKDMAKLQAVVHVSTAYSNANRNLVEEKVYPPPASPIGVIECTKHLSPDLVEHLGEAITAKEHPNTYTITKAMAESIVAEEAENLPISIVRPSIVTGAWQEPFPGWVDNLSGITGIIMEIGRGTIRSIICNDKYLVDIIPVDIVVDTLIVTAWQTAHYRRNTVMVYNCTSGSLNPIRWHELGDLTLKHSLTTPSKYLQWYPGFSFTTNRTLHALKDILCHKAPAFFVDILLRLKGSKPMNIVLNTTPFQHGRASTLDLLNNKVAWSMMKLCKRFSAAAKTGEFFALHEWKFTCDNQKSLGKFLTKEDRLIFKTDVTQLNWDGYIYLYLLGIRKFVMKDTPETLPAAIRKLNRLLWLHRMGKIFMVLLAYKVIQYR